jgi:opacity protein-like surface antigen
MRRILTATLVAVVLVPSLAFADPDIGYRGWGPRLGATMDPDQFHFGFHIDFGEFANDLRFQPNFELGIGDDLTVGALNFETMYLFDSRSRWSPYAGGGLGVNFIGSDDRGFRDGTDTDVGLNALGGIEKTLSDGDRFFTEVKFGVTDAPDVKFTLGWTFY